MPDSTWLRRPSRMTGTHHFCPLVAWISAIGLCGLLAMTASPVTAGWLGKKLVRKSAPAVAGAEDPRRTVPAPQPGFAGTIRRLTSEAQAAADRGDLKTAQTLAERAYKLAVTCRSSLANAPDCSPETTAELVRRFGNSTSSPNLAGTSAPLKSSDLVDLTPILAAGSTEAMSLVPPSPASAAPAGIVAQRPARQAAAKPQAVAVTRAVDRNESRKHIDEVPVQRSPIRRPVASLRKSATILKNADAADEPEVTTALGRSPDAQWQFDTNSEEADSSWDSRPMLDTSPSPRSPLADSTEPTVAAENSLSQDPSRIGVWSGDAPAVGLSRRARTVVSLSEFLDPSINVTAGRSSRSPVEDALRMIETDFRTPAPVPPTATFDETAILPSTSSPPETPHRHENQAVDSIAANRSQHISAAVSYREDPALDWLPASDPAAVSRPAARNWFQDVWQHAVESPLRQFAAAGLIFLLFGITLFGLSFRRIER